MMNHHSIFDDHFIKQVLEDGLYFGFNQDILFAKTKAQMQLIIKFMNIKWIMVMELQHDTLFHDLK